MKQLTPDQALADIYKFLAEEVSMRNVIFKQYEERIAVISLALQKAAEDSAVELEVAPEKKAKK